MNAPPTGEIKITAPQVPTLKIKKVDNEPLKSKRVRPQDEIDIINMLKETCDCTRSFSELDFECLGEYKHQRIDKLKPTKEGVYGVMGGICHDINEGLILGEIKLSDAKGIFEGKFNKAQMLGMSFPSESIRNKYKTDLIHYYENFVIPEYVNNQNFEVITEMFVWHIFSNRNKKIGMYGYSDLIVIEKTNNCKIIHIIDYKTSNVTDYRAKIDGSTYPKRIAKGRQLLLYKKMIHESLLRNGKISKDERVEFKLSWEMLKFVEYKLPTDKRKELGKLKATSLKDIASMFIGKDYIVKGKKKDDVIDDLLEWNGFTEQINGAIETAFPDKKISLRDKWQISERYEVADRIIKQMSNFIDINNVKIYEFSKTGNLSDLPERMKGIVEYRPHFISYDYTLELESELQKWIFERDAKIEEHKRLKYFPYIIDTEKLDIPFYCLHLCGQDGNCDSMRVVKEKLEKNRQKMTEGM